MNTTSLELSKELYAISGWYSTDLPWSNIGQVRLYELDYLLDKLDCEILGQLSLSMYRGDIWSASFLVDPSEVIVCAKGNTHVNAVAELCIELFKQNILTQEKE